MVVSPPYWVFHACGVPLSLLFVAAGRGHFTDFKAFHGISRRLDKSAADAVKVFCRDEAGIPGQSCSQVEVVCVVAC